MSNDLIKFKRSDESEIPSLLQGEPYFAWDSEKIFVGGLTGNVELPSFGVLNQNKLPSKDNIFNVDSFVNAESVDKNILSNGNFYDWPYGDNTLVMTSQDKYVAGNWRVKALDCEIDVNRLNSVIGGMELDITFQPTIGFAYVRQLVPTIMGFQNKTYTMLVDVEVDTIVGMDIYVLARFDTNDENRIELIDSDNISLAIGRQKVALTFDVPNLESGRSLIDFKNSLSASFRFNDANKIVNVKIYESNIVEGDKVKCGLVEPINKINEDVELFYEKGITSVAGLNTTSGQKRLTATFRTKKFDNGNVNSDVFDLVGNIDRVSTYDLAGARTDDVPFTAKDDDLDHITVILNSSTASGIAFEYTVSTRF